MVGISGGAGLLPKSFASFGLARRPGAPKAERVWHYAALRFSARAWTARAAAWLALAANFFATRLEDAFAFGSRRKISSSRRLIKQDLPRL